MSKKSLERYNLKNEYFSYLKETAQYVDIYVKKFINETYNSELKEKMNARYKFGKPQLRPAQVRLAYELVGGKNLKEIIPACACVELKDTGYYCIDDFVDLKNDLNLILLGELFSHAAYKSIEDLLEKPKVDLIKQELLNLDLENASGLLNDLKLKSPNEEIYFEKAKNYNFWSHALKIGGILANASQKEIQKLKEIGENIGIGYIIANDTWDFGKNLEDYKAGKFTLPVLFINSLIEKNKKINSLFGKQSLSQEEINEIRKFFVKSGAIQYGKIKANEFCQKGLRILKEFPESKARRLLEFATTMTQKNKFYDVLKQYI